MHLYGCMTTRNQTPFRHPPHCASCGKHVRDRDVTLCTRCRLRAQEIWESYADHAEPPFRSEAPGVRVSRPGGAFLGRLFAEVCA
jgi:predicted amidophosphoribosyltransferase